jgi:hypothetical protein
MRYGRTSVLRRPKHVRMLSPSSFSKRPPVDVSVRESCTQHEFLQRQEFMLSAGVCIKTSQALSYRKKIRTKDQYHPDWCSKVSKVSDA